MLDVLLVEDDRTQRAYLEATLRGGGYGAKTAASMPEALAILQAARFRVVVTDACLHEDTACALIRLMRDNPGMRRLPVIGISADPSQADRLLQAGADAFLTKPFRGSQLLAAIPPLLMRGRPARGVRLDKPN